MLALTKALQRERKKLDEPNEIPKQGETETSNHLVQFCSTMNTKLHQQVKNLITKCKNGEMDLTSLDMDHLTASLDPSLWSVIILLTESCRETETKPAYPYTQ